MVFYPLNRIIYRPFSLVIVLQRRQVYSLIIIIICSKNIDALCLVQEAILGQSLLIERLLFSLNRHFIIILLITHLLPAILKLLIRFSLVSIQRLCWRLSYSIEMPFCLAWLLAKVPMSRINIQLHRISDFWASVELPLRLLAIPHLRMGLADRFLMLSLMLNTMIFVVNELIVGWM